MNSAISAKLAVLRVWMQRGWARHLVGVDHKEAGKYVLANGTLTPAFVFLVVASCAIATLGLLLSSVAVIIGAMLIAPLMGPIILLGFAVARTDIVQGTIAAKSLLAGVVLALATSWIIVKLSPFIAPTPEILARTEPNLFDLLVAIFSGMAGGYAVVRREVGTVAGVAIATALMPPLATAGYGLATSDAVIFDGAFFLFLTNMVAISFSAAGMAVWYGFGNLHAPRELLWKTLAGLLVLAVLSVPLLRSLNETVSRTVTNKQVESLLRNEGEAKSWQLGQITVQDVAGGTLQIAALVFVPEIDKDAEGVLGKRFAEKLGKPVHLDLKQILIGERKVTPAVLPVAPLPPPPATLTEGEALRRYLKHYLGFPVAAAEIDAPAKTLSVQVAPGHNNGLASVQAAEALLASRLEGWQVKLIPPTGALPVIPFAKKSSDLDEQAKQRIALIEWALRRWQIDQVQVEVSVASDEARVNGLAGQRGAVVAEALRGKGVTCRVVVQRPGAVQAREELETGKAAFRVATVVLPTWRK